MSERTGTPSLCFSEVNMAWDSEFTSISEKNEDLSFSQVKGTSNNPFSDPLQKCTRCKQDKFLSQFFKNKTWCKECWYESRNISYHLKPNVVRSKANNSATHADWKARHYSQYLEYHRNYCRKWYRRKKEERLASLTEEEKLAIQKEKEEKKLRSIERRRKYAREWARKKAARERAKKQELTSAEG